MGIGLITKTMVMLGIPLKVEEIKVVSELRFCGSKVSFGAI